MSGRSLKKKQRGLGSLRALSESPGSSKEFLVQIQYHRPCLPDAICAGYLTQTSQYFKRRVGWGGLGVDGGR